MNIGRDEIHHLLLDFRRAITSSIHNFRFFLIIFY